MRAENSHSSLRNKKSQEEQCNSSIQEGLRLSWWLSELGEGKKRVVARVWLRAVVCVGGSVELEKGDGSINSGGGSSALRKEKDGGGVGWFLKVMMDDAVHGAMRWFVDGGGCRRD
ncbi:hypothetical protein PIB30_087670 [Stylosanthes scabra]|uniref:Uncharacterized protein n=1 Tax=Stylosanthes scabra TaxID=79078 RepID=A0ABU6USC5_9FABA|nr:hypothetical protein [Stylosanthes scabra]